jgi:hypothetical protein
MLRLSAQNVYMHEEIRSVHYHWLSTTGDANWPLSTDGRW